MEKEKNGKKKCFIVTPIGNAEDPIRRHIDGIVNAALRPALEEDYVISVAHQMNNIGSINKQVIEEIFYSDLVIANLTNRNPNVMYELAFRHCLGKPVIQIMEKGTVLPFDIGTERTIEYQNDSQGVLELCDELSKFIKNIDFQDHMQGPIYDVLKSMKYEEKIINEVEIGSDQSLSSNVLEYILKKIDQIDSKFERSIIVNENLPKKHYLAIEFILNHAPGKDSIKGIIKTLHDSAILHNYVLINNMSIDDNVLKMYLKGQDSPLDEIIRLTTSYLKMHDIKIEEIKEF